jgi:CheY-specific phosphatase CheX
LLKIAPYLWRIIINLTLVFVPIITFAEPASGSLDYTFQQTDSAALISTLEVLEEAQEMMGKYVSDTGEMIDLFFGRDTTNVTFKGSQLDILLPVVIDDSGSLKTSANFRAQIDLPRTHYRWKLFIASFEQTLVDTPQALSSIGESANVANTGTLDDNNSNSLGALYQLFEMENTKANIDLGLNASSLIEYSPFIRVKLRYRKRLTTELTSRLTQNTFWSTARGGALDLKQTFDFDYRKDVLLRSQTAAIWWNDDGYTQINQKAVLFNKLNAHRVHAYYLRGQWDNTSGAMQFQELATGINWREKLYKEWLFAELEPKLTWRKDGDFKQPIASILLMLEMRFYHRH